MKKLLAIYLVFFKGYSVIRFSKIGMERNPTEYGACDSPMEFDYGHNGKWGIGDNPFDAVIDCYKKQPRYPPHVKRSPAG